MKEVIWDNRFKRSFKKVTRKNPQLQRRIFETIELLAENPFNSFLKPHKLSGDLEGLWSCSVVYDCRIIYTFKQDMDQNTVIILLNIGTHDEVY